MRIVSLISLLLGGCVFQVDAVGPPASSGTGRDMAGTGGPPLDADAAFALDGPDQGGDLEPPPPPEDMLLAQDLAGLPRTLFELDARSPNVWKALEQPFLADYNGITVGHYTFDEMSGALVDAGGKNNLVPVGNAFSGNRRVFTHIPSPGGGGFTRTATEFLGAGFVAQSAMPFDVNTEDFTVELWLKLPPGYAPTSMGGCDPIFAKLAGAVGYQACVLAGGKLRMYVAWGGGGSMKTADSTVGLADGAWHLATLVFRLGVANGAALFVDGASVPLSKNDLAVGGAITNAGAFTIGGAGMGSAFHGSLAELAFHDNKVVALGDHQAEYRAFLVPVTPSAVADVSYAHASTLCAVVADDPNLGDRVGCYGGSGSLPAQFALSMNPLAAKGDNPGQLGMLAGPAGTNYLVASEMLNTWMSNATTTADTAASPRGDQSADTVSLAQGSYVLDGAPLQGNITATFSIWLRGHQNGDRVYLRLTDIFGREWNHCPVSLTTKWRRYACTETFANNNHPFEVVLDTMALGNDAALPAVSFDAWGAQLDTGGAPTPYVPNVSSKQGQPRGAVLLAVKNTGGRYLNGGGGRVAISFTGDAAMIDGTYLFDTGGGASDRHSLRRGPGGAAQGEVLDAAGMAALDSLMSGKVPDWTGTRALVLGWSATDPLPSSAQHTALIVDGTAMTGRASAYAAGAPPMLFVAGSQTGAELPSGTLQVIATYDKP